MQPCPHERVSHAAAGTSRATAATAVFRPDGRVTVEFTGTATTYPFLSFSHASRSLELRAESQRRPPRTWLAMLVDTFPNAKYVITSRPGAAASTWLDHQGFTAAEVEPMSWPDVREFVRHWHDAFRAESGDTDRLAQLAASESGLLESLNARRHLRLLATSPLLCALLCVLNLDRRAQLPDERMELYATALDMLLERRDVERLIAPSGVPLSKTIRRLLLEDLAYWLIRSGWSDAPRDRVTERIARKLAAMPRAGTDDGAAVLETLIVRSGLIREPVAGRIDFIHRTFEEYLAASAAVSEDQIGELVRNAHDDQWREVIVMAAGHAQPRQREELLRHPRAGGRRAATPPPGTHGFSTGPGCRCRPGPSPMWRGSSAATAPRSARAGGS